MPLQTGGDGKDIEPKASNWHKKGIDSALNATIDCSEAAPEAIYNELLLANATSMLSYDIEQQNKIHIPVSGNVGWLDYTHGLTFANAVRKQCNRFPDTWPQGLLQMACFVGRNATYTTSECNLETWALRDPNNDLQKIINNLLNHDQDEYIVSVHLLKTTLAIREEVRLQKPDSTKVICAALNRFLSSPLKKKTSSSNSVSIFTVCI